MCNVRPFDDDDDVNESQGFREKLEASTVEVQELEELGKTVHDHNSGDAGLTTEVRSSPLSARAMMVVMDPVWCGLGHQTMKDNYLGSPMWLGPLLAKLEVS